MTVATNGLIAPGPRSGGLEALRALFELRLDPLAAFRRYSTRYGPVVHFPFGGRAFTLLTARDDMLHVLRNNAKNYDKQTHSYALVRDVLGHSVLTSDGERWRRQRRVVQPALSTAADGELVSVTVERTQAMLARWEARGKRGGSFDLKLEMVELTLGVVARVLFGHEVRDRAARLSRALAEVLCELTQRAEQLLPWPAKLPLPRNIRYRRARAELEAEARAIVAARVRGDGAERRDLLRAFLDDREADDDEVCRQILTLYIAGHETTAMSLVWTLCLLASNPPYVAEVRAELARVLAGRVPEERDLGALVKLGAAVREALRLYPPVWLLERRALADDTVGGYRVPRGSVVALSLYTLQRSAAQFPDPDHFRPERHAGPDGKRELPFSAGPRMCAGADFASTEITTILAVILSRFDLRGPRDLPATNAGITLRPRGPVTARLTGAGVLSLGRG